MATYAIKKYWKKILVGAVGTLLLHLLFIILYGFLTKAKTADFLIVLGNKVELTGLPSTRLAYRLDKGLELFQAGKAKKIIVSGGIGKEGFDEAEVMAQYLIKRGVPDSAIVLDNQGTTTYASAVNSLSILKKEESSSIIIISQYFHLLRSQIAFRKMEIGEVSAEAADYFFEWRDFYSLFREIPGIYYYLIFKKPHKAYPGKPQMM